jgi:trehalose-phosphatase
MTRGSTLLALDFDGTLAPIQDDPAEVRIDRGAAALLARATQIEGVFVAIVSGRDADDLAARVQAPGAYFIASHGLEIRAPGGLLVRDTPPLSTILDAALQRDIESRGLRLELKKHAVTLHWRGVPHETIAPLADRFRAWAEQAGLDRIEGRSIVEARVPGSGKEEALRWLAQALGVTRVLYAGDDLTDFGALRFAAEHGRALFVASEERVPPPGVEVVASSRELIRVLREEVML